MTTASPYAPTPPAAIPPLVDGDRLDRIEFERRYSAMPHVRKAELIAGVVHMPSPVSLTHARPHIGLAGLFYVYRLATPGVFAGDNGTVRLGDDDEPQPDAFLMIDPARGGQARVSADHYVEGGPELVAEVAVTSVALDLGAKLNLYLREGVREYLVWRVTAGQIDWFVRRGDRFDRLPVDAEGIVRSEVMPGLWLSPAGLVADDPARILPVLQRGLDSPEHAAFVARLAAT